MMQRNFNEWVDNHTFACYNVCTKSIKGCSNVVNHTPKGGDNMSIKELNKMLEKLPEANLYDLELVVKGMLLAQKAQKSTGDKQSA